MPMTHGFDDAENKLTGRPDPLHPAFPSRFAAYREPLGQSGAFSWSPRLTCARSELPGRAHKLFRRTAVWRQYGEGPPWVDSWVDSRRFRLIQSIAIPHPPKQPIAANELVVEGSTGMED